MFSPIFGYCPLPCTAGNNETLTEAGHISGAELAELVTHEGALVASVRELRAVVAPVINLEHTRVRQNQGPFSDLRTRGLIIFRLFNWGRICLRYRLGFVREPCDFRTRRFEQSVDDCTFLRVHLHNDDDTRKTLYIQNTVPPSASRRLKAQLPRVGEWVVWVLLTRGNYLYSSSYSRRKYQRLARCLPPR